MAVSDCGGIWRRVISQDEPENACNTSTLEVLHDFKRRPSQTVAEPSGSASANTPQLVQQATSSGSGADADAMRRHSYVTDPRPSSVDAVQQMKKTPAPRIVKQASQASAPSKPSIGEIGLDILKIQTGMKGFRQLQKVATLVASSPTESPAKKSASAQNMSALLTETQTQTRCQLCEDEGVQRPRLCSHSAAMHPQRKVSQPLAETLVQKSPAPAPAPAHARNKLSAKHRIPTIMMEPSEDNRCEALELASNANTSTYIDAHATPRGTACCDERSPLNCEDASCKFDFPVPPMRRFSVFLQAPKMHSEENSFEQSNTCGIGLGLSGISIGYRLGRRKTLYKRRRCIADYLLAIATVGVILAIVETEMTVVGVYSKESIYSFCVKSMISLSTVFLLILLCLFHVLEIQLFSIDNCVEDWRVAINGRRFANLLLEMIICAIHTFPTPPDAEWSYFTWTIIHASGKITSKVVSIDNILVLPMFLRFYLCFRVMLLHSKLFTDASSRSIGALNRIKFNIRFVLKTLMTICPGTVLLVLILSLLIVASWTIRICEGFHDVAYRNIFNSLWFVSITFLSIGYGDIVPSSLCGRLIGITTGILGSGCTALVVAVVARKLELSRAEKHVHNFMLDTQLTKQLKNAAANVLRETWLIYKYTKLAKRIQPSKIRHHQRRFLAAIQALRKVKIAQRKLMENSTRLVDLPKLHHQLHDIVADSRKDQSILGTRLTEIENRLQCLERDIRFLPNLIGEEVIRRLTPRPIQDHLVTPSASGVNLLACNCNIDQTNETSEVEHEANYP